MNHSRQHLRFVVVVVAIAVVVIVALAALTQSWLIGAAIAAAISSLLALFLNRPWFSEPRERQTRTGKTKRRAQATS